MNKKALNIKKPTGFTIVELLVVVVVIGILAAVTIVSYSGISARAKIATLQSDLSNASKQIKLFQVTEASNNYPTANNCPTPSATEICLKSSGGNVYNYAPSNSTNPKTFVLRAFNGTLSYQITEDSSPQVFVSLVTSDPSNWLIIGAQVWAKANLNVGTRIAGTSNQTNNATLEKYCYNDTESNCTTYGGLYQWGEAMQYVTTNGAQGVCPAGSHIPTDTEWNVLDAYLGIDTTGTQLKPGGSSGLNMPLAGYRNTSGTFNDMPSYGDFWSSSESGINAWYYFLSFDEETIYGTRIAKGFGYSVRCIGN